MLQGVRRYAVRLHKDESGPNTVEWVLLIIVALIILLLIFWFAQFVYETFQTKAQEVQNDEFLNLGPQ